MRSGVRTICNAVRIRFPNGCWAIHFGKENMRRHRWRMQTARTNNKKLKSAICFIWNFQCECSGHAQSVGRWWNPYASFHLVFVCVFFYFYFVLCHRNPHYRWHRSDINRIKIEIHHVSLAIQAHGSCILNKKKSVAYLMGRAPENMLIVCLSNLLFSINFIYFLECFVTTTMTTILYMNGPNKNSTHQLECNAFGLNSQVKTK